MSDKCMCSVLNEKANYYKRALEWVLNSFGNDLDAARRHVGFYTNQANWDGGSIIETGDVNGDDCSGHYRHYGEQARAAMLYLDSIRHTVDQIKSITE